MRLFLGIIIGVFLTIGFAYVYDASTTLPSEPTAQMSGEQRPMMNWDVVSEKADYILANPVRKGLIAEASKWPYVILSNPL